MNHSPLYKLAIILFALLCVLTVVTFIPAMLGGPDNQSTVAGIPQVIIIFATLVSVAGLVAAYGAWQGQKWGKWLVIILSAVNGLSALPGVTAAPSDFARIASIITVLICFFVIVVLLLRPKMIAS